MYFFKGLLAACCELGPWQPPPSSRHTDCQLWHQIVLISEAGGRLHPGTGQTEGLWAGRTAPLYPVRPQAETSPLPHHQLILGLEWGVGMRPRNLAHAQLGCQLATV